MIYTSYFAKLKVLPDNIIPISICAKSPDWYNGLEYKKLAPKYDFFMKWKENHDNEYYVKCFNEQVLSLIDPVDVYVELTNMVFFMNSGDVDICLVCYEKPDDFCHRHLVSDWFAKHDIPCKEWTG